MKNEGTLGRVFAGEGDVLDETGTLLLMMRTAAYIFMCVYYCKILFDLLLLKAFFHVFHFLDHRD